MGFAGRGVGLCHCCWTHLFSKVSDFSNFCHNYFLSKLFHFYFWNKTQFWTAIHWLSNFVKQTTHFSAKACRKNKFDGLIYDNKLKMYWFCLLVMTAITFRSISCRTPFPDGKASVPEPALPPVPPASLRMEGQGLHSCCHSDISAWSMFPWEPLVTELWRGALRDYSWSLLLHLKEGAASNHFWPPFLSYALRGQLQQNTWLSHTLK